mmetsp:Transcript_164536/g.399994  ORF Transcript_164536/g.399994 Transcript_164536/m.399994 type:complete len:254 (+) Transcript_164536:1846-2607(+)
MRGPQAAADLTGRVRRRVDLEGPLGAEGRGVELAVAVLHHCRILVSHRSQAAQLQGAAGGRADHKHAVEAEGRTVQVPVVGRRNRHKARLPRQDFGSLLDRRRGELQSFSSLLLQEGSGREKHDLVATARHEDDPAVRKDRTIRGHAAGLAVGLLLKSLDPGVEDEDHLAVQRHEDGPAVRQELAPIPLQARAKVSNLLPTFVRRIEEEDRRAHQGRKEHLVIRQQHAAGPLEAPLEVSEHLPSPAARVEDED